jgi:hypothetical protein
MGGWFESKIGFIGNSVLQSAFGLPCGRNGISRIALDFAEHEKALHSGDIGQICQFGPVKLLVLVHVVRCDPKKKVKGSRHLKALHDFGEFDDFPLEGRKGGGSMIVKKDMTERDQPFADLFGIQDGNNPPDIAFLFEPPGTFVDGGDRFMEFICDLFVGRRTICLQQAQNFLVDIVKLIHKMELSTIKTSFSELFTDT